jgi:hypothetical protein
MGKSMGFPVKIFPTNPLKSRAFLDSFQRKSPSRCRALSQPGGYSGGLAKLALGLGRSTLVKFFGELRPQ